MTDCIRFDVLQSWPDCSVLVLGVRPAQGKNQFSSRWPAFLRFIFGATDA
ncbi:hypothetical protein [Methylotuvimicrobium sp. KM1]